MSIIKKSNLSNLSTFMDIIFLVYPQFQYPGNFPGNLQRTPPFIPSAQGVNRGNIPLKAQFQRWEKNLITHHFQFLCWSLRGSKAEYEADTLGKREWARIKREIWERKWCMCCSIWTWEQLDICIPNHSTDCLHHCLPSQLTDTAGASKTAAFKYVNRDHFWSL